ncbi:MAG: hypothetical protein NT007_03135, partial [Candidatus Kapabacteria bacterium]|nr:hypothetical protein [Candidatus Kapabacteria bacterium]
MSFLRMQESPKVALEWDSCIRRNDRNETYEFVCLKSRLNQKLINLVFGKNKIYKQLMEKPCL